MSLPSNPQSGQKRRRSLFRPCIDLHDGVVKQIIGGTLSHEEEGEAAVVKASSIASALRTNHTSTLPPAHFAKLYREDKLAGAHVIKLGPKNDAAAEEALAAWPGGLQVGGGINPSNASKWLQESKASKVIVTSYLFPSCKFSKERLLEMEKAAGGREKLVVDVSCRKRQNGVSAQSQTCWIVAMNKWQDLTDMQVDAETLQMLSEHCSEFLIHAADVEGLCQGIDEELVQKMTEWMQPIWSKRPDFVVTYAGGARHIGDMQLVDRLSQGRIDLTFGSALDIFGGNGVTMQELVDWTHGAQQ